MNKKLYISLFIISIIFLSIGGTFAYFTTSATATNITQIKSGNLTMTISGGGNQSVSFVPSKCTDENTIKRTIVAKTTNTSGGKVSFSIGLSITELSDTYKKNTIRYALTTNASSCNVGIVAGGNFKDKTVGEDIWLVKNDYDKITKSGNTYTKTYYLYIWLDESETEYFDGSISVKLKGTSSNNPNLPISDNYDDGNGTNTLFYKIKSSADKYTRIDFSKQSSEDGTKGIYTTTNTDNGVPVYYYRGAVDNNHVIFANFCWRIVRTTETGGVKLIYDGVPSNGECNNTGEATTIGNIEFNTRYASPAYVGYMYGTAYEADVKDITTLSGSVVFGNDVTYDESTDTYTLIDTYTLTDTSNWENEYSTIASKYHYTCFSSSTSCQSVYYIHIIYSENKYSYFFTLTSGKKSIDLLSEMFEGNINVKNSTAKVAIDTWYKDNITSYISQLEDAIFCNDRSYDIGINTSGWNKDYSNYDRWLYFNVEARAGNNSASLICQRTNDKFSMNSINGNGMLTYPVGLITADEMIYAGANAWKINTSYYLYNDMANWTLSPYYFFSRDAVEFALTSSNFFSAERVAALYGLRPVISLKKGTILSSGSGTAEDPFIVG
mgnify:CR=1 FL=1